MNPHEKKFEQSSEVPEKAKRRRFSRDYKERIIAEADRCNEAGQLGALMRREGLYTSCIPRWRKQLQERDLKSGNRSSKPSNAQELARLKRENERLAEKLRQAELIIEVQKKVSEMMQTKSPEKED